MDDIRTRVEAFWAGQRPQVIPYTIYQGEWGHTADDPAWGPLLEAGLGITHHNFAVVDEEIGVEDVWEEYEQGGYAMKRWIRRTAVGEIASTFREGWHDTYFLKTADDYRVMTRIIEGMRFHCTYDDYVAKDNEIQPYGISWGNLGRSPIQRILVDLVGLENFGLHLVDLLDEMRVLYEALLVKYREKAELLAVGPGRYISVMENFTAESLGPDRFKEWIQPVYDEIFPMFHREGKIVGTHCDGRMDACKAGVAASPVDLIESLTPPPEGDMELDACRAAWPEKLFWSNINISEYDLPPEDLKALVHRRVDQAAPDGRRLAFEISEQYQANWKQSIPVVLEALRERV